MKSPLWKHNNECSALLPTLEELEDLPIESDRELIENEIRTSMPRVQRYEEA